MRVFDCVLYCGEIETLLIRMEELFDQVDWFVIVESTRTFSGKRKPLYLRKQWHRVRHFAHKIRFVVVHEHMPNASAWDRERFQRNSVVRGLGDAVDTDLVCLSDVDEILSAETVAGLRTGSAGYFGFELRFSYFYLNYVNVAGPESKLAWNCAFPRSALNLHTPDQLRYGIRNRTIDGRHVPSAGWHFSYLGDERAVRRKITSFSHQELNNPEFLDKLDITRIVRSRQDLFERPGFVWEIVDEKGLPEGVRKDLARHRRLFLENNIIKRTWRRLRGRRRKEVSERPTYLSDPIIICPYVSDQDMDRVEAAFGLKTDAGRRLQFFFWKDTQLLGPERAFEHCWKQFPGRDVIIIHTDMRPLPDDVSNQWYEELLGAVRSIPDAGLIACDLLYPVRSPRGKWYLQCGGGFFRDRRIGHLGGDVDTVKNTPGSLAVEYDESFPDRRKVDWVTFGGLYIRGEVIDMVGDFDRRYEWAYVMDVDYCTEARIRGVNAYQVRVNLLHEESRTTREFLAEKKYSDAVANNMRQFYAKWDWLLVEQARSGI